MSHPTPKHPKIDEIRKLRAEGVSWATTSKLTGISVSALRYQIRVYGPTIDSGKPPKPPQPIPSGGSSSWRILTRRSYARRYRAV